MRPGCAVLIAFASLFTGGVRSSANPITDRADRVVIVKSAHTLELLSGRRVLRAYRVAVGKGPVGPKTQIGDHKTPEGKYIVDAKNSHSRYHLALHLSYPNEADRERASQLGVSPGGDIEIHGVENGLGSIGRLHYEVEGTNGCVVVSDGEIEEIWDMVAVGTPVEIKP